MNNNLCRLLILLCCCGSSGSCGSSGNAFGDCGCGGTIPLGGDACNNAPVTRNGCGCNDVLWLIIFICLFSSCRSDGCGF